jgi:hypothetical protein
VLLFACLGVPLIVTATFGGCRSPGASVDPLPSASAAPKGSGAAAVGEPRLPAEVLPVASAAPSASASVEAPLHVGPATLEWSGPWMTITKTAAAIYDQPSFDSKNKLGYVKSGGRLPIREAVAGKDRCSSGWHEVVSGGYVCMNLGSDDPKDPALRFTVKPPDLDAVLPYTYVRNAKNGTPLYKSVPTPDQMRAYEPYLEAAKKSQKASNDRDAPASSARPVASGSARPNASASARAIRAARAEPTLAPRPATSGADVPVTRRDPAPAALEDEAPAVASATTSAEVDATPWWQREDSKLHEVTIDTLREEADDVLAQRMVEGFYVALDKTFRWNNRLWYKTTKGLVAPADRFWQVSGSSFRGTELDGDRWKLPVGWVYGGRKSTTTYELAADSEQLTPKGSLAAFEAVALEGEPRKIGGNLFWQTTEGRWIKDAHLRVARESAAPGDIGPVERWVDVNVSTQTLVAYVGTRPVFATLVSSGKESKVKDKDHRTPRGEWRIREKHVTTTMDGDGTAAGDLPYSIEDVPYVAYFHRSFALHGAFWHQNYGVRMSHGCVNLAPLDAKYLFFFTDPQIPPGWHGVFATEGRPGSRVIVHE